MIELLERRQFLTRLMNFAAAASITGVAAGCRLSHRASGPGTDERKAIIVIGAGVAGLSAARALTDAGRQVVLLEARRRLGGRTFTDSVGAANVDLGGAWMHGVGYTPLRAVVDSAGLRYDRHSLEPDGLYDAISSSRLNMVELLQLERTLSGFDPGKLQAYNIPATSVADGIEEYLGRVSLGESTRERARFALETLYSSLAGSMDRQALKEFEVDWPYYKTWGKVDEDDFVVRGGYRTLVDFLADGMDIRTGTAVQKVVHGPDGVEVVTQSGVVAGSHAIVTVPLGVLKSGSIDFEPQLPEEKLGAIERLGFGTFEKVVLTYASKFWEGRIGVTTYYAGTGVNRAFPLFIDMTAFSGAPTLVCIYAGKFAQIAQATLDDETIARRAHEAVAELMARPVPLPAATRVTRWQSDPFSRGSYSFVSTDSRENDHALLAQPVGSRLGFAGEATSTAMASTVDGALMSGLREARRIASNATLPGL